MAAVMHNILCVAAMRRLLPMQIHFSHYNWMKHDDTASPIGNHTRL